MDQPILELRGLTKSYGGNVAVQPFDLVVPRGALYGVLGPNGAGKSTLIRMIMQIYDPDGGEVLLDGKPMARRDADRIGYLPEERGLYRKMKVIDHIVYLARLKGVDKQDARRKGMGWLERLELADRAQDKVQEFSKGMQQKVQFIATVLPEPELLILDEPFSGLDPLNARVLREIIGEQRAKGVTVLFSTHVLEQAEQVCDHIFLIHRGRKLLDGPLEDIRNAYPIDHIGLDCDLDAAAVAKLPGVAGAKPDAGSLQVELADGADPQALLRELVQRGAVRRFAAERPPLTEIFLREVTRAGVGLDEHERHNVEGRHVAV